jgi:hypothetical protein
MVTKMKMFGLFSQPQANNQVVKKSSPATASAPAASALKQFNMASIMKMQSTGCKSCRG